MSKDIKPLLQAALGELALLGTAEQLARFERYYELLLDWNARINLTAIVEPEQVACKHFADSLAAQDLLAEGARCIDVGTGAGFPGVPLMIFRDDLRVTLLDSLGKRTAFLREVVRELGLSAEVVHARSEDAAHTELRASFDAVLSRAVAPMNVLLEYSLPFAKTGGAVVAYKGPDLQEEAAAAKRAAGLLGGGAIELREHRFSWGSRTIARVGKVGGTPKKYPRRAGTPSKEPL